MQPWRLRCSSSSGSVLWLVQPSSVEAKKEHDVRVKSVVCFIKKSEINILSISRLKCLQGGINSERIPLSERTVLHISLDMSKYEALPSKMTPTLTNMLSSMKAKHILCYNAGCISYWNLYSVFKEWIVCDYEILTEEAYGGKCSRDSRLQQMLFITLSQSHIMWCYYRQYIAVWRMVRLLINVFDHVSHYCHHIWSSTWVMSLSLYEGIKEKLIHGAHSVLDKLLLPLSPLAFSVGIAVVTGARTALWQTVQSVCKLSREHCPPPR